ncbi:MAG: hypothetical protein EHM48_10615, partial [Planctomycetaceae bacterium]
MVTESFRLVKGVTVNGIAHRDITVREPMMKDAQEVDKECEGEGAVTLSMALVAKRIIKLGTLGAGQIT